MKTAATYLLAIGALYLLAKCDANPLAYQTDTHGRGKTTIYIEESFKPLFDTSIYTFEGLFPKANIVPVYRSEEEVIADFFAGKTKTICITRDFTDLEKVKLKKSQVEVRSDMIAKDAVALIVNPANPDTNLTIEQVKRILMGIDPLWPQTKGKINVVFDNERSANYNYMRDLTNDAKLGENVFAVKSNEEVIKYVKDNPNALGIIGVNWISDHDDEQVLSFLSGMKVVGIAKTDGEEYFQPYQAYIHTGEYPFTRELWIINKGGRSGLNTGFVIFMTQEKGQLIIHKSALVPANTPIRMIQLNGE